MVERQWSAADVKDLRSRLGLTQQQFAARLHVALATVVRWETGRVAPSWHLARILDQIESSHRE